MPLTPIDVQQKTFGTALRGYDLDEVDDFLDDVVTSLKDYEQRLRDAQDRISTLELEMNDRGDAEGAIARVLVTAQRSADSIIADARSEAERIVAGAQSEASELSRAKDDEKAEAESEIARIRGIVEDLRTRVTNLAAAVGARVDEADSAITAAEADLGSIGGSNVDEISEEQPVPAWEQPAALDDLDEYDDEAESEDGSGDDDAASSDEDDDSGDSYDESYDDEDDEKPVRPWEAG